jgi:selenocysteine-specific elongation factor
MRQAIAGLAAELQPRQDIGKPRLPVDRVFNIKGAGVVVTGTLSYGVFKSGDEVFLSPSGLSAHIRSVESYKQILPQAQPGSRVALNLTGVKREDIGRGEVVLPASAAGNPLSRLLDVELKLLPELEAPLKHMAEVVVFLETREMLCRVALMERRQLGSGETAFAQLRLEEDISAFYGERFIIRQQSPPRTIGGGTVLDPHAGKFKLAEAPARMAFLESRRSLGLNDLILSETAKKRLTPASKLLQYAPFPQPEIDGAIKELLRSRRLISAANSLVDTAFWQQCGQKLLDMAKKEHEADKLKKGLSQAVAQSALGLDKDIFDALVQQLVQAGKLVRLEDALALPEYRPQLSKEQQAMSAAIMGMFAQSPAAPPTLKEITARFPGGAGVVKYLAQQGELVELPEGVLLPAARFKTIQDEVVRLIKEKGQITIQDISAAFGFSRKFSIPLLTQLDRLGITRREGDARVPGKKWPEVSK